MVQKVWRRKNKKTNNIGTQSGVCNAPCTGSFPFNLHKDVTHTELFFSLYYRHASILLVFPLKENILLMAPFWLSSTTIFFLDGNMFRKGYLPVSQIPLLRASEFYTW